MSSLNHCLVRNQYINTRPLAPPVLRICFESISGVKIVFFEQKDIINRVEGD